MAKKKFDTSKPHMHQCVTCWKDTYCCGVGCEIPKRAQCLECQRASGGVAEFDYDNNPLKSASGYRKTWPGRFAVEHHTLPYRDAK